MPRRSTGWGWLLGMIVVCRVDRMNSVTCWVRSRLRVIF